MSTLQDFGGYFGRVFDAKTIIALALIKMRVKPRPSGRGRKARAPQVPLAM